MRIHWTSLKTPVGPVAVAWTGKRVVAVHMEETTERSGWRHGYARVTPDERMKEDLVARFGEVELERAGAGARPAKALAGYFAGDVRALDGLEVDPGGTPFQAKVWRRLRRIPAGRTMTYAELAAAVGRPDSARAAGGAVGANPIPLIIPCHRVIGADGKLTGFGGGLRRKRWLLRHEGAAFRADAPKQLSLL